MAGVVRMAAAALSESKAKATGCKNLRKFLGVPDRSRSPTALLISKFIRLYNHQSPGIKDPNWEENLKTLLQGKKRVGFPEITGLLSPEFTHSRIKSTDAAKSSSSSSLAEKKQLDTNKSKKAKGQKTSSKNN